MFQEPWDRYHLPDGFADPMAMRMIVQSRARGFDIGDVLMPVVRFDGTRAVFRVGFTVDLPPCAHIDVGPMLVGVN